MRPPERAARRALAGVIEHMLSGHRVVAVAEKLGVSSATVSRWVQGSQLMPAERIDDLCDAVNASANEVGALRAVRALCDS